MEPADQLVPGTACLPGLVPVQRQSAAGKATAQLDISVTVILHTANLEDCCPDFFVHFAIPSTFTGGSSQNMQQHDQTPYYTHQFISRRNSQSGWPGWKIIMTDI